MEVANNRVNICGRKGAGNAFEIGQIGSSSGGVCPLQLEKPMVGTWDELPAVRQSCQIGEISHCFLN